MTRHDRAGFHVNADGVREFFVEAPMSGREVWVACVDDGDHVALAMSRASHVPSNPVWSWMIRTGVGCHLRRSLSALVVAWLGRCLPLSSSASIVICAEFGLHELCRRRRAS